jgi:hypothetical protein
MQTEPTIGIICDHGSPLLAGCLIGAGYRVIRVSPDDLVPGELAATDAWVVDCDNNTPVADAMDWIEQEVLVLSNRPDPGPSPEYRSWCDRIVHALDKWHADFWHASRITPGSRRSG